MAAKQYGASRIQILLIVSFLSLSGYLLCYRQISIVTESPAEHSWSVFAGAVNIPDAQSIFELIYNLTEKNLNIADRRKYSNPNYNNINELNEDLFCPLQNEYLQYLNILKDIHRLQYPPDCDPTKRKFYIWKHSNNVGIMANLGVISFHLAAALVLNRTLIIHGKWTFYDNIECPLNTTLYSSMDCFFLPISNCTIQDVLYTTHNRPVSISHDVSQLHIVQTPQYIHFNNSFDVIYNNAEFRFRRLRGKGIWWKKYYNSPSLTVASLRSLLSSYIFRMQPYIKHVVDTIVDYLYYRNNIDLAMENVVSMMIRWGDKCKQSAQNMDKAESFCTTYDEEMNVFKELKLLKPNISIIIATSDTKEIIHNLTRDYEKWMNMNNMKFVVNEFDVMPKTSLQVKYHVTENIYQVMISILSTIKLQFGAKYYFLTDASNWSQRIASIASDLNCKPSQFKHNNDKNIKRVKIVFPSSKETYMHQVKWDHELSEIYLKYHKTNNWSDIYHITNIWDGV